MHLRLFAALTCSISFIGCTTEELTPIPPEVTWFDVLELPFTWESGHRDIFYLPEIIGGGVCTFDYDKDGDLDIYFIQGGWLGSEKTKSNALYRNDGDWKFTDVTNEMDAGNTNYGMGVTAGDYDNDGDDDLYITNMGKNTLLRNDGTQFVDVTNEAGVGDSRWGSSTSFIDIDNDDDLDIFVANYMDWTIETEMQCYLSHGLIDYCSPANYLAPLSSTLYQNNGDGTFTDISQESGIGDFSATGLGVSIADFDQDGFMDVFVANDGMPDFLWHNNGDSTFTEVAAIMGCNLDNDGAPKAGMGVTTQDLDDDGDFDLLVCNMMGESDSVYENHGDFFSDVTSRIGIKAPSRLQTRFGIGLFDFNNDGYIDLFEANGKIAMDVTLVGDRYAEENLLLRGTGKRFTPLFTSDGTANPLLRTSRGASFADFDNDGDTDIVVINKDAPVTLYKNTIGHSGNWVGISLHQSDNKPIIGTTVQGTAGGRTRTQQSSTSNSYFSSNDSRMIFGIGHATALQEVVITWPDGTTTYLDSIESGEYHEITR